MILEPSFDTNSAGCLCESDPEQEDTTKKRRGNTDPSPKTRPLLPGNPLVPAARL